MLAKTYAKVITTPIFYVNSYPHIGHLQSAVLADTLSRYQVLKGNCCELSTGTDEHGLKIQEAAAKANSSEIHFCNRNSAAFQSLFNKSDIKYSKFIRTTDGNHIKTVKYFWSLLKESGMIYKGLHQGWYNVSDETFVPESMVVIENGIEKCKESGKVLRWTAEENYKFKLSDFQPRIIAWLLENPDGYS
jgi:methionyl-tRNA synthetase